MRSMPAIVLASGLAVLSAAPALSDESDSLTAAPGDCVVTPAPETAPDADAAPGDQTLSDVLDPCDGVLAPAPVGDEELTVVPPPVGRTPVIAPDEVPPQPAEGD